MAAPKLPPPDGARGFCGAATTALPRGVDDMVFPDGLYLGPASALGRLPGGGAIRRVLVARLSGEARACAGTVSLGSAGAGAPCDAEGPAAPSEETVERLRRCGVAMGWVGSEAGGDVAVAELAEATLRAWQEARDAGEGLLLCCDSQDCSSSTTALAAMLMKLCSVDLKGVLQYIVRRRRDGTISRPHASLLPALVAYEGELGLGTRVGKGSRARVFPSLSAIQYVRFTGAGLRSTVERDQRLEAPIDRSTLRRLQPGADEIVPGLFIGDSKSAASATVIRGLFVTHVLNCTDDIPNYFETEDSPSTVSNAAALPADYKVPPPGGRRGAVPAIQFHRIPVKDSESSDLRPHMGEAVVFVTRALESGGTVLIHCRQGMSRSVSMLVMWLMARSSPLYDSHLDSGGIGHTSAAAIAAAAPPSPRLEDGGAAAADAEFDWAGYRGSFKLAFRLWSMVRTPTWPNLAFLMQLLKLEHRTWPRAALRIARARPPPPPATLGVAAVAAVARAASAHSAGAGSPARAGLHAHLSVTVPAALTPLSSPSRSGSPSIRRPDDTPTRWALLRSYVHGVRAVERMMLMAEIRRTQAMRRRSMPVISGYRRVHRAKSAAVRPVARASSDVFGVKLERHKSPTGPRAPPVLAAVGGGGAAGATIVEEEGGAPAPHDGAAAGAAGAAGRARPRRSSDGDSSTSSAMSCDLADVGSPVPDTPSSDSSDAAAPAEPPEEDPTSVTMVADAVAALVKHSSMDVSRLTGMRAETLFEYCQLLAAKGAVFGVP